MGMPLVPELQADEYRSVGALTSQTAFMAPIKKPVTCSTSATAAVNGSDGSFGLCLMFQS